MALITLFYSTIISTMVFLFFGPSSSRRRLSRHVALTTFPSFIGRVFDGPIKVDAKYASALSPILL
jgi:hypothetical protein